VVLRGELPHSFGIAFYRREVPIANVIVVPIAKRLRARIISDDPHFRELGIKMM